MSGTLFGVVLNSGVESNMEESRLSDFRKIHCELSAKHTNANTHWYYQNSILSFPKHTKAKVSVKGNAKI